MLFLSSANLTAYSMNFNMELAVLVRSIVYAERVAVQFEQMNAQGVRRPISESVMRF